MARHTLWPTIAYQEVGIPYIENIMNKNCWYLQTYFLRFDGVLVQGSDKDLFLPEEAIS
jgi:hypothetical protein